MTNAQEPRTPTIAAQIEALAAKATGGPWASERDGGGQYDIWATEPLTHLLGRFETDEEQYGDHAKANAELVCMLKNSLPAIVTALRQAEAAPGVVEADSPMCENDPMYQTATEAAFAVGQAAYERRGVTPELRRVVRMALEAEAAPAAPSADAAMVEAGTFLLDRLSDHENGMTSDEDAREWHGHVAPAIARFRAALEPQGKV